LLRSVSANQNPESVKITPALYHNSPPQRINFLYGWIFQHMPPACLQAFLDVQRGYLKPYRQPPISLFFGHKWQSIPESNRNISKPNVATFGKYGFGHDHLSRSEFLPFGKRTSRKPYKKPGTTCLGNFGQVIRIIAARYATIHQPRGDSWVKASQRI
jgi:hypothetical protein